MRENNLKFQICGMITINFKWGNSNLNCENMRGWNDVHYVYALMTGYYFDLTYVLQRDVNFRDVT